MLVHLNTQLTKTVVVDLVSSSLNGAIQGEMRFGSVHNLTPFKVVLNGVEIRDRAGRAVIRAERLAATPDWSSFFTDGTIRISRVRVLRGEVILGPPVEDEASVLSIVEAFQPLDPGDPDTPPEDLSWLHVVVDDIVLDGVRVRGDVPGVRAIRVEDGRFEGRVEVVGDRVEVDIFDGRAVVTGPTDGRTDIENMVGRFDSDMTEGLNLYARAQRDGDRVRARVRVTQPRDAEQVHLEVRAALEPVRAETLADMGVPGADALEGTFRGGAVLEGPVDDLELRGGLTSEAGSVQLRGHIGEGGVRLEADTEELRVHRLVPSVPELVASGGVSLDIGDGAPHLHADLEPTEILGVALPTLELDATIEDDHLTLDRVHAPHLGGTIDTDGRIGFDGSLDLDVDADIPDIGGDPNVRRSVPGARGALRVDASVRAGPEGADLSLDGTVALRDLRYGPVRAALLRLSGQSGTQMPAPVANLSARAEGLSVGDIPLGTADATLRGGPAGYDLRAESRHRGGPEVDIDARLLSREEGIEVSRAALRVDPGDGAWTGELVGARLTYDEALDIERLELQQGRERIRLEGTYRFRGADRLLLALDDFDLSHLRPALGPRAAATAGRLDGELSLDGDLDVSPTIRLDAELAGGAYGEVRGAEGHVALALEDGILDGEVALDLGAGGRLWLRGPLTLPPAGLDAARHLRDGTFDGASFLAENVDIGPVLASVGAGELGLGGRLTADVSVVGPLDTPVPRYARVLTDPLLIPGWDALRIKLRARYDDRLLILDRLWVADAQGELATADGSLPLDLTAPPTDGESLWASLRDSTEWRLTARAAPRRLDGWPRPLGELMPPGLRASAGVFAQGTTHGPFARIEGQGQWVEPATGAICAEELLPRFTVRGELRDELAIAQLGGYFSRGAPEVTVDVAAAVDLDRWVAEGRVEGVPASELQAHFSGVNLGDVPWTCEYGEGPLFGHFTAKDLLTGSSFIGAVLDVPTLRLHHAVARAQMTAEAERYRMHARIGQDPEEGELSACLILGLASAPGTPSARCLDAPEDVADGELHAQATLPVDWLPGVLPPIPSDERPLTASTLFSAVELAPLLRFIPGVVSGNVLVSGELGAEGALSALALDGAMDLSEGRVQVEGLGQHLDDIRGRVELSRGEVRFPEAAPITFRDSGGTTELSGRVSLEGIVPRELDLRAAASQFPVRNEGIVLARLTGDAAITGTIGDAATESRIVMRNATVRLPEQSSSGLQGLGLNQEVLVVGEARPEALETRPEGYVVDIDLDASAPFWVRRNDFAVQVWAELNAVYRDPDLAVSGVAHVNRGTFEIFGKRFELQPGGLTFDGSPDLDPAVNITAVYELPGQRGATVTVSVGGFLSSPTVAFSSTETNDRGEIIALLLSGGQRASGTEEEDLTEQATSFLAGLTAGILTLGLRQEFGDIIPVLAIETTGFETRVRAGFNAEELIPDVLRGVVTGAYIEGFLTAVADNGNAAGSSSGAGGVGGGVTLEFSFPNNVLLRGTVVPPDTGSLDVVFEP